MTDIDDLWEPNDREPTEPDNPGVDDLDGLDDGPDDLADGPDDGYYDPYAT